MKQRKTRPSFSEITSKKEAEKAVNYLIEGHDLDIAVEVEIADRFKRKAGQYRHDERKIRISKHLLDNHPEKVMDTLKHEIAHAVVMDRYADSRRTSPHGREWKSVMQQIGVDDPSACYSLQLAEYNYIVRCTNPECDVELSRYRRSRLVKQPDSYRCNECGSSFESFEAEEGHR